MNSLPLDGAPLKEQSVEYTTVLTSIFTDYRSLSLNLQVVERAYLRREARPKTNFNHLAKLNGSGEGFEVLGNGSRWEDRASVEEVDS